MPYYRTQDRRNDPLPDVPSGETAVHNHYSSDTHHRITLSHDVDDEYHECEFCGQSFSSDDLDDGGVSVDTQDDSDGEGESESEAEEQDQEDRYDYSYDEEQEEYECGDCDFTTEHESGMKGHYTQKHGGDE